MASAVGTKISSGQGNVIKRVDNVKRQGFKVNRLAAANDRKGKKNKGETGKNGLAGSGKDGVKYDKTEDSRLKKEGYSDSGQRHRKGQKGSEARGGKVDLVV